MSRKFDTPEIYRSNVVSTLKKRADELSEKKKDFTPFEIVHENLTFRIARHFGFCFGVENAVEIAYRAIKENPDKRIFLLSEMIHNPMVNKDLLSRGVKFLMTTRGETLIPFTELQKGDVVVLPAFGVTIDIAEKLKARGVDTKAYDTTCPFVEKVWRRSNQLGSQGYSIIIHGKHFHEETKATFSHAEAEAPAIIVRNTEEALKLAEYMKDPKKFDVPTLDKFYLDFKGKYSKGFNPFKDLVRVGVVNQTTMLAEETKEVAQIFRKVLLERYGEENLKDYFADTRDTLCYATSENQASVKELVKSGGDLALVIGGHNSSNTTHLAKLCRETVRSFHITGPEDILSSDLIRHYNGISADYEITNDWFLSKEQLLNNRDEIVVLLTAGASTPDSVVDAVIERVKDLFSSSQIGNNKGIISAICGN